MKLSKKITTGLLLSASALALAGCSTGTIDDAVAEFDGIESGDIELTFAVDSETYGEYGMNLTGQFEYVGEGEEGNENDQASASGIVQKVNATELEEEQVEPEDEPETEGETSEASRGEGQEGEEDNPDEPVSSEDGAEDVEVGEGAEAEVINAEITSEDGADTEGEDGEVNDSEESAEGSLEEGALLEEKDPSRDYNYQIVEENNIKIDGQETTSTGEIIALGDTLYDKVFLTGSEADGRFVYDSRDVGIMEYPVADFVTISPIIDAFDLENSDIEVTSGDLHNGEKGHVFEVTPEQVVTSLQDSSDNTLTQNILGLVTETNVDSVIIGLNGNSFTVEAISTGTSENDENPTSEADTSEDAETDGEETVIGSLVLTKTEGDVEITEPTNAMDLDEFTSLVELFYQQQAEQQLEQLTEEGEVYGEDAKAFQEQQEQENAESTEEQEVESEEAVEDEADAESEEAVEEDTEE